MSRSFGIAVFDGDGNSPEITASMTRDLGGTSSTVEAAEAVIESLQGSA